MANQLASNPWIVDTPVGAPGSGGTPLFQGNMQHAQLEYVDYTSTSHHVEVQDRNGRVIARLTPLQLPRTGRMGWVYGLQVPATDSDGNQNLESGKLLVYFE